MPVTIKHENGAVVGGDYGLSLPPVRTHWALEYLDVCVPDHRQAIPCRDIVQRRSEPKGNSAETVSTDEFERLCEPPLKAHSHLEVFPCFSLYQENDAHL